RLRFSESDPGQVTGYSVTLPGHARAGGAACWYGGGRLAADLTLPRLRRRWERGQSSAPEHVGSFRVTAAERNAIYEHAARQATAAAKRIRWCARGDPAGGTDAAWAAGDALHAAARAVGSPRLRRAAESYDRAARAGYGRVPLSNPAGDGLRAVARLVSLAGRPTTGGTLAAAGLVGTLAGLVGAVAELREAQQHAAQAAAARAAAEYLRDDLPAAWAAARLRE